MYVEKTYYIRKVGGGVRQGSEKKKASVGLFSTFRHPLDPKPPNPHQRRSVDSEENPALHLLENTKLHCMDPDDPPMSVPLSPRLPCTSGTVQDSLQILANEVHASHLSRQGEYVSGKSTDQKYKNRVREYLEWWENDQVLQCEDASKNGALWITIPAHPITATKVALYLDYVVKRPQVNSIFCFSLYSQPQIFWLSFF